MPMPAFIICTATIYEAACWAHARRKFHEIHVMHASPTTTEALARIGALYASKGRYAASPPISGLASASREPGPCWTSCEPGWRRHCVACLRKARPRARSDTRYGEDGFARDRQQRRGAGAPGCRTRTEKLPIRWIRLRRRAGRGHVLAHRVGQAKRARSGTLSPHRAGANRRSSSQQNP